MENMRLFLYPSPLPPSDPLQFSCKRQLEKMGGDPDWYLTKVRSSDINDGLYYFPNAPGEAQQRQEMEKMRKPKSLIRRLVERIARHVSSSISEIMNRTNAS